MQQVSFRRMDEGNAADYQLLNKLEDDFVRDLPDRIMAALQNLEQSLAGYQVSRLEHPCNRRRAPSVMVPISK